MTDRPVPAPPAPAADREPPEEQLAAYPHTILHFDGPPALVVDLRQPLDDRLREGLVALGLDGPFAVLTAENPEGAPADDAPHEEEAARQARENAARTRTLEHALDAAGAEWVPVTGTAPDGSHAERCVAVRLALREALRLAHAERQLALFWYDGTGFWLMPADADGAPRRLPAPEARAPTPPPPDAPAHPPEGPPGATSA